MASPSSHHSHDPRAPKPNESFDEYAERQRAAVPPVLYLPVTGGGGNVAHEIEMRPTKDGRMTIIDSLNGGVGGEFILNALANLGELAGEVAQVNTAAANRLRTTVDEVQGIDDEAATDFRLLEESVP